MLISLQGKPRSTNNPTAAVEAHILYYLFKHAEDDGLSAEEPVTLMSSLGFAPLYLIALNTSVSLGSH